MKKLTFATLTGLALIAAAPAAQAAFYFEGLEPYLDPPNCNDPFATTCGRYGQVPHVEPEVPEPAAPHGEPAEDAWGAPHDDEIRLETRDGLSK